MTSDNGEAFDSVALDGLMRGSMMSEGNISHTGADK